MLRARPIAALALLVATACARPSQPPSASPPALRSGDVVRAGYDGTVRSFRGTPLVVNFWASWCEPCQREMPLLVAAAKRMEGRVAFLGVDVDDTDEAARDFLGTYAVPYPSITDPDREAMRSQKILGVPATLFYRS